MQSCISTNGVLVLFGIRTGHSILDMVWSKNCFSKRTPKFNKEARRLTDRELLYRLGKVSVGQAFDIKV
jgi:hypothetical protein